MNYMKFDCGQSFDFERVEEGKAIKKLVYLASPYNAINCRERDRLYYAKKIALEESKKLKKYGYIPISPILLFSEVFDEQKERERALKAGLSLLDLCDYIYVADHPDSAKSKGIKAELEYARKVGVCEIKLELF